MKNKKVVKKKAIKRNYNKMKADTINFQMAEEKSKLPVKPKIKDSNSTESRQDNIFTFNFQIDKTYMPPSNVILKNEGNRKLNLPIYNLLLESYSPNKDINNLKKNEIKQKLFE